LNIEGYCRGVKYTQDYKGNGAAKREGERSNEELAEYRKLRAKRRFKDSSTADGTVEEEDRDVRGTGETD